MSQDITNANTARDEMNERQETQERVESQETLTRREFLNKLSLALSGIGAAIVGIPVIGFLVAPLLGRAPEIWRPLGPVAQGLRAEGLNDEAGDLLRAARFRHPRDQRFQDLWRQHQFQRLVWPDPVVRRN